VRPSEAMLDRLERVIETLQDNSVKMGQMLAVHDEKLDKQDRIDAVLFEKVDERLRKIEMKMWSIAGAIAIISFVVSPIGQKIVGTILTPAAETSMIYPE